MPPAASERLRISRWALVIGYVARGSSLSLITDAIYCLIGSEEVVPPPSGDDAVSETCLEHPDKSDTTVRPMAMQRQLIEKFVIYLCFVCIFDNLGEPHEYW